VGLLQKPFRISALNLGLLGIRKFADSSGEMPMLCLNVSAISLLDLRFPDILAALLKKRGVPANKLLLEITESGLIKELTSTLDVLSRLRLKGIQLSIDDFGTGYSMMRQLQRIPATELKIDKSFVKCILENRCDEILVQKTIEIGHELGMIVVAEGVETIEQLAFLRASHCDTVQGFLFSRPLAADDLAVWLQSYCWENYLPEPISGLLFGAP
jgi:EAL domain-containing protein (putative c-di-GMP-specific phosphodiesterase class I)